MDRSAINPERMRRLDEYLQTRFIDTGKIAGAQVLIAHRGEVGHRSCLGLIDREKQIPVREDHIYRIYSMTKPITSIALLQLFERGLLRLDDPVHRYLPQFRNMRVYRSGMHPNFETVPAERPITVHDLLTHQSGLTYGFQMLNSLDAAYRELGLDNQGKTAEHTLEEWVDVLAGLPLLFSPGERWCYSVATDVIGYLVQVISGMPFEDYLKQHIFDPLGMVDTGFSVPEDKLDRFAPCYLHAGDGVEPILQEAAGSNSAYVGAVRRISGGGGLVSTVDDYHRFAGALAAGGRLDGVEVIGSRTLDFARQNHLPGNVGLAARSIGVFSDEVFHGLGFGLGVAPIISPQKMQVTCSMGEYSWEGMASTFFWIDPVKDLLAIFMTQLIPFSAYPFSRLTKPLIYAGVDE
ncbi:MAG: beta-lactamase family protein [Gammaproteobacteria bacterium AqS3]|nr:beta-lactamase family protein [Gammaproteobacteria bacterium AqS3]